MNNNTPYRAIAIIAVVAAIPIIAVVMWMWRQWLIISERYPFFTDTLSIFVPLMLAVFVAWGIAAAITIAWRRWGARESVRADKVIGAFKAQRPLPDGVQNVSWHDSHRALPAAVTEPLALPAPDIAAPAFAALLSEGTIGADADGRRQPLILGYADDGPITGDWRQLYSSGIGGLQGSGKTWGASFLLAQSALNGAGLVICDPHAEDTQGLAHRVQPLNRAFVCDIAQDDREILHALNLADDILQARKAGDADRTPLIVAIDEWASLRRGELANTLPRLVEDFSTEGRKLNCHVLLLSQRWDKASVGSFRNTLASSYVYRLRPDEARMLTGLRAEMLPKDTLQLAPAEAYFLNTYGQILRVRIPKMTQADMAAVGAQLPERRPFGFQPKAKKNPNETQMKPGFETQKTSSESAAQLPADVARVLSLWSDGKSVGEIVKAIHGDIGGPKYNAARADVETIIRLHWRGGTS